MGEQLFKGSAYSGYILRCLDWFAVLGQRSNHVSAWSEIKSCECLVRDQSMSVLDQRSNHVSAWSEIEACQCLVRDQRPCHISLALFRWNQGRIEPPKAARGHATSNSANIDSIVLNVTKNRGPCAACKTTHTIEVLISIYKYTLT